MNTTNILERTSQGQHDNPESFEQAGSQIKDKVKDKARALQETAQDWQRQATDATRKAARATDVYVHDNPWTIIASVAVGFLVLGILLGRSRD